MLGHNSWRYIKNLIFEQKFCEVEKLVQCVPYCSILIFQGYFSDLNIYENLKIPNSALFLQLREISFEKDNF